MSKPNLDDLYRAAREARDHAYAPYSHFKVGAAIHCVEDDAMYPGCNVENASYGGTICAERSAVMGMVSRRGRSTVDAVVVVTDTDPAIPPCGLCLQVLAEFCPPDAVIGLGNLTGIQRELTLRDLLPLAFTEFPRTETA